MWSSRFGAAVVDSLLLFAIFVIVTVVGVTLGLGAAEELLASAILGIAAYLGPMLRHGDHNGQTFGKQMVGIRVTRDDGEPVGLSTAFRRDLVAKPALGILTL